jgi:hypothetical protein
MGPIRVIFQLPAQASKASRALQCADHRRLEMESFPSCRFFNILRVLYQSGFGTMLRESNNAFSVIESVHVLEHYTAVRHHRRPRPSHAWGSFCADLRKKRGAWRVAADMVRLRSQRGERLPALLGGSGEDVRQSQFPDETGAARAGRFQCACLSYHHLPECPEWESRFRCLHGGRVPRPLHRLRFGAA